MIQESKDGIPLRFKGIVIYRVTDPVKTANLFDFTKGSHGHDDIKAINTGDSSTKKAFQQMFAGTLR